MSGIIHAIWPEGHSRPWGERAACAPHNAGTDVSHLFFASPYESRQARRTRIRKAVQGYCNACPVRTECYEDREDEGIWGGVSSNTRTRK